VTGGIAGPGGATLAGTGTVWFVAANSYTGATTLAAGTLRLSASERVADASPLRLVDGTLLLNGLSETAGSLDVDGAAVIDFGGGASTLRLADSAAETWAGTVLLRNWTSGADHLYVGTSATLSEAQLAKILSPSGQKAAQRADGEVVLLPLGTLVTVR
jgi:autotransporter-associated beta strand protein